MTRDRATWLCYLLLAVYAWFLYGFGPVVPLLGDEEGVSRAVASLHGTALAVGTVLAGVAGPRVVARTGRRFSLWGSAAGMCVGVAVLVTAPSIVGTLTGVLIIGLTGSIMLNSLNALLATHHPGHAATAISEANALAAAVGTVSPLAVGAAEGLGLGWRVAIAAVLPMVAGLYVVLRRAPIPDAAAPDEVTGRLPSPYWSAWMVLVLLIAVEFSYTIWSSELIRDQTGASDATSVAAVSALVFGMAVGRYVGARLAYRSTVDTLVLGAIAVTAVGFAILWGANTVPVAALGLLVSGLGIALHFPLGLVRAIEASAGQHDLATGRAAFAAGLASGGGPFILGALADVVGVVAAFLVVPCLLVLAASIVLLGRRER